MAAPYLLHLAAMSTGAIRCLTKPCFPHIQKLHKNSFLTQEGGINLILHLKTSSLQVSPEVKQCSMD